MSKQDIQNVTTLAAYLSDRPWVEGHPILTPKDAARDAMALQRLGRSACTNAEHSCNGTKPVDKCEAQAARIHARASEILKPYGLTCRVTGDPRGYCLKIMGLPGNTWGGDESGYGI